MASLTQWTWVWANSRREGRTEEAGVLQNMESQRAGHNLVTGQQQHCKSQNGLYVLKAVNVVTVTLRWVRTMKILSLDPKKWQVFLDQVASKTHANLSLNGLSAFSHSYLSPTSRGSLIPLCFLLSVWCHLKITLPSFLLYHIKWNLWFSFTY